MTTTLDAAAATHSPRRALPRLATAPVIGVAAVKLALQCMFLTGYGWHRDEFYYLVGGRHLSAGYVDHPLLTPFVARAVETVFGPSLGALRLVPALVGAGLVVLTALLTRELGGGRNAQIVAGLCLTLDPFYLGANHFFQTVTFDQLAWVLATLALVRLIRSGDERWWLAIGAACAFGLLAKATIVVWIVALLLGMLLTPARVLLRSRWFAVAAGLAALGGAPFLWFQVQHGWPFPQFLRQLDADNAGGDRPRFIPAQLLLHNPVNLFVWIPGLVALFRDRVLRTYRAFAWAFVAAAMIFLVTGAKYYYLAPAFPLLYAAGATQLSLRWQRFPRGLVAGLVVGCLIAIPAALPVLPARTLADSPYGSLNKDALEQVGWPAYVRTVTRVVARTRRPTMVVTSNYGEAGALDVLGRLDARVRSRQNSYWLWGRDPAPRPETTFVLVNLDRSEANHNFTSCRVVTHIDDGLGIENEEQGAPISVCSGLRHAWPVVWSALRKYG